MVYSTPSSRILARAMSPGFLLPARARFPGFILPPTEFPGLIASSFPAPAVDTLGGCDVTFLPPRAGLISTLGFVAAAVDPTGALGAGYLADLGLLITPFIGLEAATESFDEGAIMFPADADGCLGLELAVTAPTAPRVMLMDLGPPGAFPGAVW